MTPQPPPSLPDYELLRLIGRGSYGDVWLARSVTGHFRAVKIVSRERFPDDRPYEREFSGIRHFAAVSHTTPHQLALLHVGRHDAAGFFYYVMELADDVRSGLEIDPGSYVPATLRERLRVTGHFLTAEVLRIGVDLARALDALHRHRLVHRDIKPANIIFVGGVPKLADIGLVAAAREGLTYVGTEGYVPPEGPGTAAADLYSLGKVLYEAVSGLECSHYPQLPSDLGTRPDRKDLLELNEVLIRACEPHAARRYPTASALLDDLLFLQAGRSVRKQRQTERRLARAVRTGVALGAIALVAAVGGWVERQRAATEYAARLAAEADRDRIARRSVYAATMARAQRSLEQHDYGRARDMLESVRSAPEMAPVLGFEWEALWQQAQGDPAAIFRPSGPAIGRLALSHDERWLAVHDADRVTAVYQTETGEELGRVAGLRRLGGFSRDGAWLLGTTSDDFPAQWSWPEGRRVEQLSARPAFPVGITREGRAVFYENGAAPALFVHGIDPARTPVRIELAAGAPLEPSWDLFYGRLHASAPIANLVLMARRGPTARRRVVVVDTSGGGTVLFDREFTDRPLSAVFRPAERDLWVAVATGRRLRGFDVATQAELPGTLPLDYDVFDLQAVAEDAASFYGRTDQSLVARLQPGRPTEAAGLRGALGRVTTLEVARTRTAVFVGTFEGEVRRFDTSASRSALRRTGFRSGDSGEARLQLASDGKSVWVPLDAEQSIAVDLEKSAPTSAPGLPGAVFAQRDKRIWAVTNDARTLISYLPGEAPSGYHPAPEPVLFPKLSPDGTRIVAGQASGAVVVWSTAGPAAPPGHYRPHQDALWFIAFTRDGRRVWTLGNDRDLVLSDPASGTIEKRLKQIARSSAGLCTADGRWLVLATEQGFIEVRAVADGSLHQSVPTASGILNCLALSPDGRRLAAGGAAGRVHILDTASWTELCEFRLPVVASVADLAFTPDGRRLLAWDGDGGLTCWETAPVHRGW